MTWEWGGLQFTKYIRYKYKLVTGGDWFLE